MGEIDTAKYARMDTPLEDGNERRHREKKERMIGGDRCQDACPIDPFNFISPRIDLNNNNKPREETGRWTIRIEWHLKTGRGCGNNQPDMRRGKSDGMEDENG